MSQLESKKTSAPLLINLKPRKLLYDNNNNEYCSTLYKPLWLTDINILATKEVDDSPLFGKEKADNSKKKKYCDRRIEEYQVLT